MNSDFLIESFDYKIFYSHIATGFLNQVNGFTIGLLFPQIDKAPFSFKIEDNAENVFWDRKILCPGDFICESIEIKILSYCKIAREKDNSLFVHIFPLSQCFIPKPLESRFSTSLFNSLEQNFVTSVTCLKYPHNSLNT